MSESFAEKISWSSTLEEYFKKTGEKAECYAWLYWHSEAIYSKRRTWIDLPVSVVSSLTGFFSVGSSMMFEGEAKAASISLGVASLLVAIMNSTKSYFAWDKKAEGCKISAISYAKLYRFISVQMGLPVVERMGAGDLLLMVKDTFDRLAETSYPVCPESIDAFKKKFSDDKYQSISRPEVANGLEAVNIYKDMTGDGHVLLRVPSSREIESPMPAAGSGVSPG
jgi:hypothetical protein